MSIYFMGKVYSQQKSVKALVSGCHFALILVPSLDKVVTLVLLILAYVLNEKMKMRQSF